jgi:hypothetical protein
MVQICVKLRLNTIVNFNYTRAGFFGRLTEPCSADLIMTGWDASINQRVAGGTPYNLTVSSGDGVRYYLVDPRERVFLFLEGCLNSRFGGPSCD